MNKRTRRPWRWVVRGVLAAALVVGLGATPALAAGRVGSADQLGIDQLGTDQLGTRAAAMMPAQAPAPDADAAPDIDGDAAAPDADAAQAGPAPQASGV